MTANLTRWLQEATAFNVRIDCLDVRKQWSPLLKLYIKQVCLDLEGLGTKCDFSSPVTLSTGEPPKDDWLITGIDSEHAMFNVKCHSATSNRINVSIHGVGANKNKQVEISRNGYLGLYKNPSNPKLLKLEPLEWGETSLKCRIRDHQGHVVKVVYDRQIYLNAQHGDEVTFLITRQDG